MPETKHGDDPVFVSLSLYTICPAPALPGTSSKLPLRWPAAHGAEAGAATVDEVVVVAWSVTVSTCVTVCVTVVVPPPPQPARARTATARSPALTPWEFATAARGPPRATRRRRRAGAAPVRASRGRALSRCRPGVSGRRR